MVGSEFIEMDPSCLVSTVLAGGGIMVWGIFFYSTFVQVEHCLRGAAFPSIVTDHSIPIFWKVLQAADKLVVTAWCHQCVKHCFFGEIKAPPKRYWEKKQKNKDTSHHIWWLLAYIASVPWFNNLYWVIKAEASCIFSGFIQDFMSQGPASSFSLVRWGSRSGQSSTAMATIQQNFLSYQVDSCCHQRNNCHFSIQSTWAESYKLLSAYFLLLLLLARGEMHCGIAVPSSRKSCLIHTCLYFWKNWSAIG